MLRKRIFYLLAGFAMLTISTCALPESASNAMMGDITVDDEDDIGFKSEKNSENIFIGSSNNPIRFVSSESEVEAGKKVFEDQRCFQCHPIRGAGGSVGPDLSKIGEKRDALWLKRYLPNPKADLPFTMMPPFKGSPEELDALVNYLSSLKNKDEDNLK